MIEIGASVKFPRSYFKRSRIVKDLVFDLDNLGSKAYAFGGKKGKLKLYRVNKDSVFVPRMYGLSCLEKVGGKFFDPRGLHKVVDKRTLVKCDLEFKGDLRERQVRPVKEILRAFKEKEGLTFQATPGFGKTTVILYIIAQLGLKSLVLVHTSFLVNQWRERIKQFLHLDDSEIGLVQQNVCDIGKPITIGMIQSLASDTRYPDEFYSSFGMMVVDECHRIAPVHFSRSIRGIKAKYYIGVSATVTRKDGLNNVIYYNIGKVGVKVGEYEMNPRIYLRYNEFNRSINSYKLMFGPRAGQINLSRLITDLSKVGKRNDRIVRDIKEAWESGRKILLFSDRLKHLEELADLCEGEGISRDKIGFYIGQGNANKKAEKTLKEAASKDIILATYQLAKEGLDIVDVDTLILATPKVAIEQPVGRVLRRKEGKDPIVIDYVDSIVKNFAVKRLKFYDSRGWRVIGRSCLEKNRNVLL